MEIQWRNTMDKCNGEIHRNSKVGSLEPSLEAVPSLCAMLYIAAVEPTFFLDSSWNTTNLIRAYGTMCFTMALFLKSGPCFFLQSQGIFSA